MSVNNDLAFEMAICTHGRTFGALHPRTVCRSDFDTAFSTVECEAKLSITAVESGLTLHSTADFSVSPFGDDFHLQMTAFTALLARLWIVRLLAFHHNEHLRLALAAKSPLLVLVLIFILCRIVVSCKIALVQFYCTFKIVL